MGNPGVDQQMGNAAKLSFFASSILKVYSGWMSYERIIPPVYAERKKKSESVGENNGNRLLLPYPTTPSGSFGFGSLSIMSVYERSGIKNSGTVKNFVVH